MNDFESETTEEQSQDKKQIVAGLVLLGSVWGLLECVVGSFSPSLLGIDISMGAVLAGFFALGIMVLARRAFSFTGAIVGMAVVAGVMRFYAPIGTVVICSAIAIVAEGVIFEIIMSRKQFSLNKAAMKDPRTLAYLGVVLGYSIFVTGYITTLVLTPVAGGSGSPLDVVDALPLVLGRGFFAALAGGIAMPLATLSTTELASKLATTRKELYYGATIAGSLLCWVSMVSLFYVFEVL